MDTASVDLISTTLGYLVLGEGEGATWGKLISLAGGLSALAGFGVLGGAVNTDSRLQAQSSNCFSGLTIARLL
jgi:hypothetical protein